MEQPSANNPGPGPASPQGFSWDGYITGLSDFPSLAQKWERDFTETVRSAMASRSDKNIIDLGCSNGRWLRYFRQEYRLQAFGLDNNPSGFTRRDLHFVLGDIASLPFPDRAFDLVLSLGLVEHFRRKARAAILEEHVRILRPGGLLICEIPILKLSFSYVHLKYKYDYQKGYRHYRTTDRELKRKFRRLNMEIVADRYIGFFPERYNRVKKFPGLADWFDKSRFFSDNYLVIARKKS